MNLKYFRLLNAHELTQVYLFFVSSTACGQGDPDSVSGVAEGLL